MSKLADYIEKSISDPKAPAQVRLSLFRRVTKKRKEELVGACALGHALLGTGFYPKRGASVSLDYAMASLKEHGCKKAEMELVMKWNDKYPDPKPLRDIVDELRKREMLAQKRKKARRD